MASYIGLPLNGTKLYPPSEVQTCLGILINTATGRLSLPGNKIVKILSSIDDVVASRKVKGKQMERLLGSFNFACRAFPMARPFMRRLYTVDSFFRHPSHRHRLPLECRKDLQVWSNFFKSDEGSRKLFLGPFYSVFSLADYFRRVKLGFWYRVQGRMGGGFKERASGVGGQQYHASRIFSDNCGVVYLDEPLA